MRIVRTRSIPNVDDERLLTDLQRLHDEIHTPEGLHEFDEPRRSLVNKGMKVMAIRRELLSRNKASHISCRFCGFHPERVNS